MHHMRIALDEELVGHRDRTDLRHAADIVAAKVDQHQMLGALLLIGEELFRETPVLLGRRTARARSGDRPDRHFAVPQADEDLGARPDDRKAGELQEVEKWRGVEPA